MLTLLTLSTLLLLVGTVNALTLTTWDNWKYYDKETKTITIKNNLILKDLEKATLVSNTYNCGVDCSATKEITLYEDGVLINDLRFYRLFTDGSKEISEPKKYNLKYYKDVGEFVCNGKLLSTLDNGTEIRECLLEFNGNNKVWSTYELGTEVKAGNYEVELTGTKKINRIYDWQIQMQGRWINEWATWGNISLGDDGEVLLIAPPNNTKAVIGDVISFNATANITGGDTLVNMSFYFDTNGTWFRNETINTSGIGVAIAFNNVSSASTLAAGHNTQSTTHTASGSNRFAIVGLSFRGGSLPSAFSVTYDGAAMTHIINSTNTAAAQCYIFALEDPSTTVGATVSASWTGGQDNSIMGTTTYTGVQGGTGNTDTDSASSQFTAINLTGMTADDFAVDCFASAGGGGGDPAVGGDQTRRYVVSSTAFKGGGSTQDGVDLGEMDWNNQASDLVVQAGVVLVSLPQITTFAANFSKTIVNQTIWNVQACDSSGTCGFAVNNRTVNILPVITVFSPTNSTFTTSTIFFNATADEAIDTFIVNWNGTNATLSAINTTLEVEDGVDFNLLFYGNSSSTGFFGLNDTIFFSVDATVPSLNVTEPFNVINFQDISENQTLRFNVSDISLDTCLFQYEGSNTTVDCSTNITNFTIGTDRTLTFFVNDSGGNLVSQVVNWSYLILQISTEFNSSDFETANQRFTVNVTTNGSSITAGSLTFDGTENTGATITNPAGDNFSITRAIAIPASIGTKTPNFNLTIIGKVINTTLQTQVINATNLTICGAAPQNIPFLNITFRNETLAQENITATISSTFTFSLSSLSGANKTFTFTNATENPSYAFCGNPNRTINIQLDMTYNNQISQQRSFTLTTALSNIVLSQVLFLLPTAEGLFSPFVTVTTLGVAIADVKATITRIISGSTVTIASGFTDGSGFITFFLDPDESYTGVFEKSEFITQTFSFTPTAGLRTVTLARTTEAVTNGSEITLNTTYQITPINITLANNTNVTFGFNVTSEQTITFMSLNITNSTGSELGFASSTTQGFISVVVDTGNNTKLLGTFLFNTSEESITIIRTWIIANFFLGDYSIFRQLTLTVDNVLISEFFRFLLVIFTITGTIIFLTTREITDTSESKIIVITLLIWAFSLVGWLDTGIFVPDSGQTLNDLTRSTNQFGIAILTTIFTVFFISRRVFIRKP